MAAWYVAGYDPGGDGTHGLAVLRVRATRIVSIQTYLLPTVEGVLSRLGSEGKLLALGVDTLTCWSTGVSGWRPADRWLRKTYPEVRASVISPNGLFGSMGLGGMGVIVETRRAAPDLFVTETHPKVLYWCLGHTRYAFGSSRAAMNAQLSEWTSCPMSCESEHEWDAAVSAWVALQGLMGRWQHDLHALPPAPGERIIAPAGPTVYCWPVSGVG
jgi:hypothetical protein